MGGDFYDRFSLYFGDLHNHCDISYGHGPLESALANAALQLDFVSVTGHAAWPDMAERPMPEEVAAYHLRGFSRLRERWGKYVGAMEAAYRPGSFVTIGGYEWHSFRYGDYTVLSKDCAAPMILPADGDAMRERLRSTDAARDGVILMPHHIGYKTGFRGVSWDDYNPAASPLVEIVSMHGCAESNDSSFPYLHTMGPLDDANTVRRGLERGYLFGVTGSTDHHSAHPGSYGYGKTAVWADGLTREALWRAFLDRRTYAVSGDRIALRFSVNGEPMGGKASLRRAAGGADSRVGEALLDVVGGDALSRIEIVKNGRVWHQENFVAGGGASRGGRIKGKVLVELGWGEKGKRHDWNLTVRLSGLTLLSAERRFRGVDVVDPLDKTDGSYSFTSVDQPDAATLVVRTNTFGNATSTTSQTQAICLELAGNADGAIELSDRAYRKRVRLAELFDAGVVDYLSGFLSPAIKLHAFVPERDYTARLRLEDAEQTAGDVYHARVYQRNRQAAWSSPVRLA